MFEDYTQQRQLISCNFSICLAAFTHNNSPINLCACQGKSRPSSSFVPLSSKKTGHYFPRRKGARCRPACTTKAKQSPVIACHQTENTDSKCMIEGGYGCAYCKPVKDVRTIYLPRNCRANQNREAGLVVDSLEPDMTHT